MKSYIKANTIVPEIRMNRRVNKLKSYLIVEGTTDKKFFKNIIMKDFCLIKEACGKSCVENVMRDVKKANLTGVLGVVDSDFDKLMNKDKAINILTTDTHDLETLILKTGSLEVLINEYGDDQKIEAFERDIGTSFIQKVLDSASIIGMLRYISSVNHYEICFDDIPYKEFISCKNLDIDEEKLIDILLVGKRSNVNRAIIKDKLKKEKEEYYDPWQICCGHDISGILAFLFENTIGNSSANGLKADRVELVLRTSYNYSLFKDTALYKDIIRWQNENIPWKVMNRDYTISA